MKNELYHYGILGMRWGVRRTPEQLGHRRNRVRFAPYTSNDKTRYTASNKTRSKLSPSVRTEQQQKIASDSKAITKEATNILDTISRNRRAEKKVDLSHMTDAELRAAVNRMNLEQQYRGFTSNQIAKGEAYLREAFELTGSVLAIGSSALGIALAIEKLKGR